MKTLITFTFALLVSGSVFAMACGEDGNHAAAAPEQTEEGAATLDESAGDNLDMRSSESPSEPSDQG